MAEYREALRLKLRISWRITVWGRFWRRWNNWMKRPALSEAARLRPEDGKFHGNLGAVLLEEGKRRRPSFNFARRCGLIRASPTRITVWATLCNSAATWRRRSANTKKRCGSSQYKDAALALQRAEPNFRGAHHDRKGTVHEDHGTALGLMPRDARCRLLDIARLTGVNAAGGEIEYTSLPQARGRIFVYFTMAFASSLKSQGWRKYQ